MFSSCCGHLKPRDAKCIVASCFDSEERARWGELGDTQWITIGRGVSRRDKWLAQKRDPKRARRRGTTE